MFACLSLEKMTKRYGSSVVLDQVSLELISGRMHALMGKNGAGKSTLIKLIAGVVPADNMRVHIDGAELPIHSPTDATAAGFRFIHQELNIVPQLSVAENILLGRRSLTRFGIFIDWRAQAQRAQAALDLLGVTHIDPRSQAGDLSHGDLLLIKLASAVILDGARKPRLYVLDEPTAALRNTDSDNLFKVIDRLKSEGAAILYVSHRIDEVMRHTDDVTVLRNGRHICTCPRSAVNRAQLMQYMTGQKAVAPKPKRRVLQHLPEIARLSNLSTRRLQQLDFQICKGEVIGLAGLGGAGQSDVLKLFMGLEKPVSGTGTLNGADLPTNPTAAWKAGVSYLPKERRTQGLMLPMSVRDNIMLPHLDGVWAKRGREQTYSTASAAQVNLEPVSVDQPVSTLSGGNQQKVVFARAISGKPHLILLDEPTRGIDISAREDIHAMIRQIVTTGVSCLVSSSDMSELLHLSDRIILLHKGRQTDILPSDSLTLQSLVNRIQH